MVRSRARSLPAPTPAIPPKDSPHERGTPGEQVSQIKLSGVTDVLWPGAVQTGVESLPAALKPLMLKSRFDTGVNQQTTPPLPKTFTQSESDGRS
jgi:hypothetical protein